MSIFYPDNASARTSLSVSGISNDSNLTLNATYSGSEKKISLAELKKTGVQVINVLQYGADPTGVADSTTAIQTAIDAAESSGCRVVYFPPGTYLVSDTIYIRGTNTDSLPNEFIQSFRIYGAGPQSTFIEGTVANLPVLWFVGASNSRLESLWIANSNGDAIRFTASHRSFISNIHAGRGTSDVCIWNDGSQQLRISDCMLSPNIVYKGDSTRAKYGIVATSYAIIGTAVAGSTGLSGKTLTVSLTASSTVTVSGNGIQDVADAVNGASTTTGVVASVDGDSRLILSSRTFTDASGINDNASFVLTDGTGAWSAAGHVAATNTYGTGTLATNAMRVSNTTSEQMGFAGAIVHSPKFSVYDRADSYFDGCTMQGNGYTSGPTYVGDLILDRCIGSKVSQCHLETETGVSLQLNGAHNTAVYMSYMFDLDIDATQNASFFSNTITGGSIDATSELGLFVANELYLTGGSFNKFSDLCDGTRWISNNGTNASSNSDGFAAYSVSNMMSEIISYNGKFEYWNGTSHPIGWAAENGATITRSATSISGPYAVQIVAGSGQVMSGLGFTFANADVGRNIPSGSTSYRRISVTITAKRTTDAGLPGVAIDAGSNQYLIPTDADKSFPKDVWVTRRFQGYLSNAVAGDVKVIVTPSNTGDATASMLVDEVVITAGFSVPDQYAPMSGENASHFFLRGKYIDSGSSAPVTGYYPAGSIRFNSSPTAGGKLGFVCTSGGSPGTWKEFGAIDP